MTAGPAPSHSAARGPKPPMTGPPPEDPMTTPGVMNDEWTVDRRPGVARVPDTRDHRGVHGDAPGPMPIMRTTVGAGRSPPSRFRVLIADGPWFG
ncbi:hypothetical protein [Marinactinospora rubrisoli]|uniref:Uncharacterized protein n=1 Tax=Marinactinospora rubrisoli TaxID=2715399 RepID=A0ABW2KCY8_9ACTN